MKINAIINRLAKRESQKTKRPVIAENVYREPSCGVELKDESFFPTPHPPTKRKSREEEEIEYLVTDKGLINPLLVGKNNYHTSKNIKEWVSNKGYIDVFDFTDVGIYSPHIMSMFVTEERNSTTPLTRDLVKVLNDLTKGAIPNIPMTIFMSEIGDFCYKIVTEGDIPNNCDSYIYTVDHLDGNLCIGGIIYDTMYLPHTGSMWEYYTLCDKLRLKEVMSHYHRVDGVLAED